MAFSSGWTGIIGSNGCGKSTLLKILSGDLKPTTGEIIGSVSYSYYCHQETTFSPKNLNEFVQSYDKDAINLKSTLSLHSLIDFDWQKLSQGEQKRFQLACALWQKPDLLLVDEPTNHLDAKNREHIIKTLQQFKGIGVLVSHDRQLLNALCKKCVFFSGDSIYEFLGNYDESKSHLDEKFAYFKRQKENINQKADILKQEVLRLNQINETAKKRLSKTHINHKDHDTKAKIDGARLTGKDASFGQKKLNIENRIEKLKDELKHFQTPKDYAGSIEFTAEKKADKIYLHLPSKNIPLLNNCQLFLPELIIKNSSKIGLIGLNGVGKTSFINFIINQNLIKTPNFYHLKQEMAIKEIIQLKEQIKDFNHDEYARCLQIVARLGSDAKQIIKSKNWSSGEARKVAIACAIVRKLEFLILDEPTNHLDLESIQNLETALTQSQLALLIVSHDRKFIDSISTHLWEISRIDDFNSILKEL